MSNIMLKELYVDNFKSFHKSKFEFGKVNCLIAPNNAGKSNLVEVLEYLEEQLIKNPAIAIHNMKIFEPNNYRYKGENIKISAIFDINNTVLVKNNLMKYQMQFGIQINFNTSITYDLSGKIKSIKVDENDLRYDIDATREYNNDIAKGLDNIDNYIKLLDKKRFRKIDKCDDNSIDKTIKILLGDIDVEYMHLMTIKHLFSKDSLFSSFYFHPQTIKKQQNYETNFLLKNGTNLAYFLDTVDEDIFNEIKTSIIWEVELIDSMEIVKGSIPTIVFKENVNDEIKDIIYQKVSDGTINLLALMTALKASKSNCLVFEEPERHLHMKILYKVLNHFRESEKQIFFTTHSSEILNDLNLDEIIFLYRDDNGNTQGKRAKDIENIKKIMKLYKNDLVELLRVGILDDLALEDN